MSNFYITLLTMKSQPFKQVLKILKFSSECGSYGSAFGFNSNFLWNCNAFCIPSAKVVSMFVLYLLEDKTLTVISLLSTYAQDKNIHYCIYQIGTVI